MPSSFDALPARYQHRFGSRPQSARLEQAGQPIGGNDLLIAAQALAPGHTIVTGNEREFARIADLPRENWLRVP